MQKETWTLYLISAHYALLTESTSIYARDEDHVRYQMREWIAQRNTVLIEVQACPDGFTVSQTSLPGTIEVPVGKEGDDDEQ